MVANRARTPWDYIFPLAILVWLLVVGLCLGIMVSLACEVEPTVLRAGATGPPGRNVVPPDDFDQADSTPLYSEEEVEMLALAIYQEAGGDACSNQTRQMVGEVVLNRMAAPRYPDTMYEVLTQRAQYGRLHWTGLVWPERARLPQEAHAVKRAYDCAEVLLAGVVERLLPEDTVFQAEFKQGTEVVVCQDGIYFCR